MSVTAADRLRLWHPRGVLCAVCRRPARGFGWSPPPRSKQHSSPRWFCCIACQGFWSRLARRSPAMVDLTEQERAAIAA
ncbi:MAG: hypothetical protein Q8M47_05435, partial [Devosia sp.]|nr:hypothetical protein [Devosia sp.]